jgi:hypothetical protein
MHQIHMLETHSSSLPACKQVENHFNRANSWRGDRGDSDPGQKKTEHMIGLHRSRCHSADFKTWKAPLIFWSLELTRKNVRIECYDLNTWRSSNRTRWRHRAQKNASEASDVMCIIFLEHGLCSLERCIASTSYSNVKACQTGLSTVLSWN